MYFYSWGDATNFRNREKREITVSSSINFYPEEGTLGTNLMGSRVWPLRRSGRIEKFISSIKNQIPAIPWSSYDTELTRQL